jgi:hypothetical protein
LNEISIEESWLHPVSEWLLPHLAGAHPIKHPFCNPCDFRQGSHQIFPHPVNLPIKKVGGVVCLPFLCHSRGIRRESIRIYSEEKFYTNACPVGSKKKDGFPIKTVGNDW